jgi:hypothetical protein
MDKHGTIVVDVDELQFALETAHKINEPYLDLAHLTGQMKNGPKVAVKSMLDIVTQTEHPQLSLSWNDKTLSVASIDGGVLGTFEIRF